MLAPTLIVGLGGTGCKVVAKVAQRTSEEQRKRVRFVCIDTDVNDLRKLREANPMIKTIQTSAPYSVGEYLNNNTFARDTWFPTHHILNGKTPTEGAGQVRAISRLAFDTCISEGAMKPLEKCIEELYPLNGEAVQQALRIIVVSSLAGGTGSGIILPAAVYIKSYLEKRLRRSASVMRGFLLLPDIFFDGKSPEEINNLGANGYAALRELDAFMRRGDSVGEGSDRFRRMTLKMPDTSTGEYVDYQTSPFNFCFLFGAQNTSDQDLSSFSAYMEQAANIVYAQSVSALSGRSNSSEDNTILTLCAGSGHNRFCGAGSSSMTYPRNDIARYAAVSWALQTMGGEWQRLDKSYRDYRRRQEEKRRLDPSIVVQTLPDYYMEQVEGGKDSFLKMIYRQSTMLAVEGGQDYVGRWEKYIEALDGEITRVLGKQEALDSGTVKATRDIETLEGEGDVEEAIGAALQAYKTVRELEETARVAAAGAISSFTNNVLRAEGDLTRTSDPINLEYHLHNANNEFMHICAVRYFLYGLDRTLAVRVSTQQQAVDEAREGMEALASAIDDPDTTTKENISQYNMTKKVILLGEKLDKNQRDDLAEALNNHVANIKTLFDAEVKLGFLKAVQESVKAMLDGLDLFNTSLTTSLEKTERERVELYARYRNGEGHATYHVCADDECLDGLMKEMPFYADESVSEVSATIFAAIKKFSIGLDAPTSKDFADMYDTTIMEFWTKQVERKYGAKINMNVVDALMAEARYKHAAKKAKAKALTEKADSAVEQQDDLSRADQLSYCRDKLAATAALAEPFIEKPMGEQRHPIKACCYSKGVRDKFPDFIVPTLSPEGGDVDADISDYEIIFYHAIYGIKAVDLQQFSPALKARTLERRAGIYFSAYKNRVCKLGPVLSKNLDITPHLDRNWHLAMYMPDLSDEVHNEEVKRVYRAMVWGLLSGTIQYKLGDKLYVPESNDNRDFVVPSELGDAAKTNPCDKLSELVDALSVNPPQVDAVLQSLENQIAIELRDRKRFEETMLVRRLKWFSGADVFGHELPEQKGRFRVDEFDSETDASVFDLLYWVKFSTPVDDYQVENMNLLRDAILELVEYYISRFVDAAALNRAYELVLVDQAKQFVANMMAECGNPDVPKNRILDDTVNMVISSLSRRFRDVYQIESPELAAVREQVDETIKQIRAKQDKNPFAV